jgi:protocatechuate 3,4-dioxygenase beta subunit
MKILRNVYLILAMAWPLVLPAQTGDVKLSGTAVDAAGKPVADAAVDCYTYAVNFIGTSDTGPGLHTTTDAGGAFTFSVREGPATVVVKKAGVGTEWRTMQMVPKTPLEPITLGGASALAGQVVDDKEQPVADAQVTVVTAMDQGGGESSGAPNFIFGQAANDLFSARTTADGHFRISDFPTGAQANLNVKTPGRVLRRSNNTQNGWQLAQHAGQEDIKLVVEPGASIEGKVVQDGGAPLAHARVEAKPAQGWGGLGAGNEAESADDGSFRISELEAGTYRVGISFTNRPMAPLVSAGVPVTVVSGQTERNVKVQTSKGGVVEVTVVNKADRKPVAGVQVAAYSQEYQGNAVTGPDGKAMMRLPPGQFTMFAMRTGSAQSQTQETVAEDETNRVRIELPSPYKISGVVRDSSGAAVAGTSMGVYPDFGGGNMPGMKSDANGHFEVEWTKPDWGGMNDQKFYLMARNMERNLAAVREIDEKTTNADMELKPAMSVSGKVQDASGKPVPNMTAYVMLQMENTSFGISRGALRPDSEGVVRINALPRGEKYSLGVNAAGYGSASRQMDAAVDAKADHYDFPPVTLKLADRKLAGRVLGTDGKPVAGAQVWINGDGQPSGNAQTDKDGRFSFDVCEGPISVTANGSGSSANTQTRGGDTNAVVRLGSNNRFNQGSEGPLTISGIIYDASGNPAGGARVMIVPTWGMGSETTSDTSGEFTIHWQAMGRPGMKFALVARDVDHNLAGIEFVDEKTTKMSVHLAPGLTISGTVLDSKGDPLRRANVNLNMVVGNNGGTLDRQSVRVQQDGTFTISALPKGQSYRVHISAGGYGASQKVVGTNESAGDSVQLTPSRLKLANLELSGRVVDPDGKPMSSGVYVNIQGNNQPNGGTRTDDQGHFKFKVCDGFVTLNGYAQNMGRGNNWGTVEARAGDTDVVLKIGERRGLTLKPPPLTLTGLVEWPLSHKKQMAVAAGVQVLVLLGMVAGVFLVTSRRKA